jgi:hypothetical protein
MSLSLLFFFCLISEFPMLEEGTQDSQTEVFDHYLSFMQPLHDEQLLGNIRTGCITMLTVEGETEN